MANLDIFLKIWPFNMEKVSNSELDTFDGGKLRRITWKMELTQDRPFFREFCLYDILPFHMEKVSNSELDTSSMLDLQIFQALAPS